MTATPDQTPAVHLEIRLELTAEQATAAFAALSESPYSAATGETGADTVTAEQARAQLAALVVEYGMKAVRREAEELPEWEFVSGSDTRLVDRCRRMVLRHLAVPLPEGGE